MLRLTKTPRAAAPTFYNEPQVGEAAGHLKERFVSRGFAEARVPPVVTAQQELLGRL